MSNIFNTIIGNASALDYADSKCIEYPSLTSDVANLCEALKYYRDTALREDYNKLVRNYVINYQASEDISKIKAELFDEYKWQASNAGNTFAQLMVLTKRTCNLIEILVPASKANKAILESYKFYQLYKKYGRKIQDFATTGEYQFLKADNKLQDYLDLFNVIKQSAKEIDEMIKEFEKTDKEWKDFKITLQEQINNLDKSIKNYNSKLAFEMDKIIEISEIQDYINKYLLENCKLESLP